MMLKNILNRHLSSTKLDALLERVKKRNLLNYGETLEYTVELETKLKAAKGAINDLLGLCEQYRDITMDDNKNSENIKLNACKVMGTITF